MIRSMLSGLEADEGIDDPDEKPLSVREVLSSSDQVVKRGCESYRLDTDIELSLCSAGRGCRHGIRPSRWHIPWFVFSQILDLQ